MKLKSFYFLGLAGAGMASIARVLVRFGYQVSGWDDSPDPRILDMLAQEGIQHIHWQSIESIDCMVYSTAIAAEHPALIWARNSLLPLYHRSDILAWLSSTIPTIAVCGSHGKTTTTSMIHHAFNAFNIPHVVILGGVLNGNPGGHANPSPKWLVIEACESDRTFLKYQADYVVLTNISADHLEAYHHSLDALIEAFSTWIQRIRPKAVILPSQGETIQTLCESIDVPYYKVGPVSADYTLNYQAQGLDSLIELHHASKQQRFTVPAPGAFNGNNAAMVLALLDRMGLAIWEQAEVFKGYKRVERRFDYRCITQGQVQIHSISDYGHHPNEMRATIETVRQLWPNLPIRMVFEPHRYSRTAALLKDFISVLAEVDAAYILPIYSASETPIPNINSECLAESLGRPSHRAVSHETLADALIPWRQESGVVIFQGAGHVHRHALDWLKSLHAN